MTIGHAIEIADRLKPNAYPDEVKVGWLSSLDGQIFEEEIVTHEGGTMDSFIPYDPDNKEQELLVPHPYAEGIYINYLQMQIDKENGETGKYNQSASHYNNVYSAFRNWYNRTHMPRSAGPRFMF